MLNPVHLRTLGAVVEAGSFADAARRLGYTSSAVSQQIASLERAVKVPLFERGPHAIRPTPVATYLVRRAGDVLSALETLETDVRGVGEGRVGRLKLGSFPTASQRLLPIGLALYTQSHASVEILLDEGEPDELIPLVQAAELDLALVYRYDLAPRAWPDDLVETTLLEEELVLLLPQRHPLAGAEAITLGELASDTWVAAREGTAGASCLVGMCARAGFEPRIAYRSNDYGVIRGLVRSGLGVALIPALAHQHDENMVAARLDGVVASRRVVAVRRRSAGNPAVAGAVRALRRAAVRLAGDLPGVAAAG